MERTVSEEHSDVTVNKVGRLSFDRHHEANYWIAQGCVSINATIVRGTS